MRTVTFKQDNYIVIVNHDIINYQTITINLKGSLVLDELTPLKSGQLAPTQKVTCSDNGSIVRTLLPGGYLIFHWIPLSINVEPKL